MQKYQPFILCMYANRGTVSPKVDVYAFGVMLYELISAKAAIVDGGSATDPKGLVTLVKFISLLNYKSIGKEVIGN